MQVVLVDCNYRADAPHPVFLAVRERLAQSGVEFTVDNAWSNSYAGADLIIGADPLRDRVALGLARILGQRTLNRFERMAIAKRNGASTAAFGSPKDDAELSVLARDWNGHCVLKYDWSSRRNGIFLWPLGENRQPFPDDFRVGSDLFMEFLDGDPLTYKIDAFCGTILGGWIFTTRSMRQADWQLLTPAPPCEFDPPPEVQRAIRSASEALVSYGVGYASYDLMRTSDSFRLIEINSCSVSTEAWNYWPERYAHAYGQAILRTLKRLDTVPRFNQLRLLAQRAGNDQSAVVLPERRSGEPPRAKPASDKPAADGGSATAERAFFNDLAKTERLPQPALVRYWQTALAELIRHAHRNAPFYATRLAPLLMQDGSINWGQWFDLPIIRFDQVTQQRHAMIARGIPAAHGSFSHTRIFGPAGEVGVVSKSSLQLAAESAIRTRLFDWHAVDPAGPVATLLTDRQRLASDDISWVPPWRPGPRGVEHVGDAKAAAETQLHWLSGLGPVILQTRPVLLRALLEAVAARPDKRPALTGIVTQGETVSDADRQSCRQLLGHEIIDCYETPEAGIVAIQCPTDGTYHIQSEVCLVEVLDSHGRPCGPSDSGELIITPIYSFAMPLLRYGTGTTVQLLSGAPQADKACICGRTLPAFRCVARAGGC